MNDTDSPNPSAQLEREQASPVPSIEASEAVPTDAPAQQETPATTNGVEGTGGDSEAETEIESPVKKREAEKKQQHQNNHVGAAKSERSQKSRIGNLPVPHDDDDDDGESAVSAFDSAEQSVTKTASSVGEAKREDDDADMMDRDDFDNDSDQLSSAQSDDDLDSPSPERAVSERPQQGHDASSGSPNPRKRKHRASSVSLPNSKRQSMDPPKRTRPRATGGDEDMTNGKPGLHRRTVSTQSAIEGGSRKRRSVASASGRDLKGARNWEESDASSETTSRGHDETGKRPLRATARLSSATPGRVPGQHKRHVNKYGLTGLALACEEGNLDLVKEWRAKDPEQLEIPEFAGNKPLQIAALNGNLEVAAYLIEQGCLIDCANVDKDTPLIDAAENGHLEVVKLLLEAGVDPLRQNIKGQQALDVIKDDNEEAIPIRATLHSAIDRWNSSEAKQRREDEEEHRHRAGPSKELHFMARSYDNLLKLVQNNDRNGVQEFLAARVPVDNTVIAAAAKTGDLYLLNMLAAEMSEHKARERPERPMLSVLGTSHFDMVVALTELEHFDTGYRTKDGKSWAELAEQLGGPMWKQEKELLQRLELERGKNRLSSSPVIKRDGSRRFQRKRDGNRGDSSSDEMDDADDQIKSTRKTKPKNGRRLMSRRDMRAAGGSKSALSESSGDDEDAEGEMDIDLPPPKAAPTINTEMSVENDTMKPPDTPTTRRRLRSKSISSPAQPAPLLADASGRGKTLRRRSSSVRAAADLPTVGEEKLSTNVKGSSKENQEQVAKIKKEREEEAKSRLEEAARLEAKRNEEEAAAAEAKRAEEAARKAEQERKAEEDRKAAEVLRQHEEAEQARREEEERQRQEREKAEAEQKRLYAADVLAALPQPLARVLDPEVADEPDAAFVQEHFLPLPSLSIDSPISTPSLTFAAPSDGWTLNLHAAALLPLKTGLQLFFQAGKPGFEGSLASQWLTQPLQPQDWHAIDSLLARLPWSGFDDEVLPDASNGAEAQLDFAQEMRQTAHRYQSFLSAKNALRQESAVALRRVRIADVKAAMRDDLQLKDGPDLVDLVPFSPITNDLKEEKDVLGLSEQSFVQHLGRMWEAKCGKFVLRPDGLEGFGARWEDVVCVLQK